MITLIWTVLFCLGWRIITDEGQLLYFIRKPFEHDLDHDKEQIQLAEQFNKSSVDDLKRTLLKHKLIVTIGKPFVLCITCMASIWGITVFVALNGLHEDLIFPLILNCVSASFIQTFIWSFYERYIQ
jgi:hypothetical protein